MTQNLGEQPWDNPPSGRVNEKKMETKILVGYVALGTACICSFLPWGRVLFFTVSGTDGDGVLTAVLSGLALLFLYIDQRSKSGKIGLSISIFTGSGLSTAIYIYTWSNIARLNSNQTESDSLGITVTPQLGLMVGSIAAVISSVVSLELLLERRRLRCELRGEGQYESRRTIMRRNSP